MSTITPSASPLPRSPPPPDAKRPKGILKHSFQQLPPTSPPPLPSSEAPDHPLTDKEKTLANTQINAGQRRSSSAARLSISRRQSSRTPSYHGDGGEDPEDSAQRLKWDEVNLYLTEQERTAKMKIDEPKTPYAQHYDPAEDPSDDEDNGGNGEKGEGDIPGLSLGEPEEEVPEGEFERRPSKVHVDDSSSVHGDSDNGHVGMSAEELEKHRRFEQLRKRHYEMKNVAHLLGHSEEVEELVDDEDEESQPVPAVPNS